jgi:hypothetical protein
MSCNLRITGLYWDSREPAAAFFNRIDKLGGWPLEAKYCIVQHGCDKQRSCYFSTRKVHDDWNSTIYSSDDYYWWKLSDHYKKQKRQDLLDDFKLQVSRIP